MVTMRSALPDWLRALYPFEPKRFRTPAGAEMSYLDEGPRTDEVVLMLHGNPTWSFYYRRLVSALSDRVRCIAPDHIGMGLSDKPADYDYRLETRIADIAALVETLGVSRVHLVVHDWGGAVGFGFAASRPDLIGRIVILNTAAFPSKRIPERIALCRIPVLGTFLVRGFNGFAGPATRMAMNRRQLTSDEKRAYLYPYGSWSDRVAIDAFVKDIPIEAGHPSRAPLEHIGRELQRFRSNPALIVWGGKDFCFDDQFYSEWQRRLPEAATLRLADAGHYVLEDAADDVIPHVSDFLTRRM